MSSSERKEWEKQLQAEYSFILQTLTTVLLETDKNFEILHKYSNEDYLRVNPYLQDYGHLFEIALNDVVKISDEFLKSDSLFTNELIKDISLSVEYLLSNETEVAGAKIQDLDTILGKTRSALLINLSHQEKLNMMITEVADLSNSNGEYKATKVSSGIEALHKKLTDLNVVLRAVIKCNEFEIQKLHQNLVQSMIQIASLRQQYSDKLNELLQLSATQSEDAMMKIALLTLYSERCIAGINRIISCLQYHDITSQRIEHIRLSFKEVLLKLDEKNDLKSRGMYINMVPEITGLNISQLKMMCREYQIAFQKVLVSLKEIDKSAQSIIQIYDNMPGNVSAERILVLEHMYKALKFRMADVLPGWRKSEQFDLDISMLLDTLTELNNYQQEEQVLADEVILFVNNIRHAVLKPDESEKLISTLDQISQKCDQLMDKISGLASRSKYYIGETERSAANSHEINALLNESRQIAEFAILSLESKEEDKSIRQVKKNLALIKEASQRANQLTGEFGNMPMFEKLTYDTINILKKDTQHLTVHPENLDIEIKVKHLREFGKIYTMQSERVHLEEFINSLLQQETIISELIQPGEQDTDNTIELF